MDVFENYILVTVLNFYALTLTKSYFRLFAVSLISSYFLVSLQLSSLYT